MVLCNKILIKVVGSIKHFTEMKKNIFVIFTASSSCSIVIATLQSENSDLRNA